MWKLWKGQPSADLTGCLHVRMDKAAISYIYFERHQPNGLHAACAERHQNQGGLAGIGKSGLIEEGIAQAV